jgi:polysaccharide export outer membrane protein
MDFAHPAKRQIRLLVALAPVALSACATLPTSGPTAHEIMRDEQRHNTVGFHILNVTGATVDEVTRADMLAAKQASALATLAGSSTNDLIGPGDVLQINIFEVGVALFGSTPGGGFDPSARGQGLPAVTVDRDGAITLPYAGRLVVAGHTTSEAQRMIENGLRGVSQRPQALVTVRENINNIVYLFGAIKRPGRYPLTLGGERLLDAIALGSGSQGSAEDTLVRITRQTQVIEERLGRIRAGDVADVRLVPGDRIELIDRPRTFLILGASSKVSQVPFATGDVSLAEAVARAGGPNDQTANPTAIFVFRYDPRGVDGPPVPTVYRLNMMMADSYFLSQRFMMHDKDVIYIANAAANVPSKLVSIINQLFSPVVTARYLAQ